MVTPLCMSPGAAHTAASDNTVLLCCHCLQWSNNKLGGTPTQGGFCLEIVHGFDDLLLPTICNPLTRTDKERSE